VAGAYDAFNGYAHGNGGNLILNWVLAQPIIVRAALMEYHSAEQNAAVTHNIRAYLESSTIVSTNNQAVGWHTLANFTANQQATDHVRFYTTHSASNPNANRIRRVMLAYEFA
jgi:hypothetical protein